VFFSWHDISKRTSAGKKNFHTLQSGWLNIVSLKYSDRETVKSRVDGIVITDTRSVGIKYYKVTGNHVSRKYDDVPKICADRLKLV
jgi:hypothetical protein